MKENFEQIGRGRSWSKRFNYSGEAKERLENLEERGELIDRMISWEERQEYLKERKEFVKIMLEKWKKNRKNKST